MAKFAVCPECEGTGSSSAYLGAFTADEWNEMDDEWRADYARGAFNRPCSMCMGQRVVTACHCGEPVAYSENAWGLHQLGNCSAHLSEADVEVAESDAMNMTEIAFGC